MRLYVLLAVLLFSLAAVAQPAPPTDESAMPDLERFSPDQVDKALDPCNDFFQYACGKWVKANPIPADQASWGTFNKLAIWNIAAIHNTLEQAAAPSSSRSAADQKAGDHYASCMDEAAINQAGIIPLKPVLDQIFALKDKAQLPELIASLHQIIRPANLNFIDAQYQGILFGIYNGPSFDDASVNIGALDQSGMNMPSREFYLNDDDKSKEIREKYRTHVARMLELSGEGKQQAEADAVSVLAMETALAKAAMDIVVRRDPKNINHKMSAKDVQALTPSFNWNRYFAAMHTPVAGQYLVLSPDFFRGVEKLIVSEPVEHWRAYLRYSLLHLSASSLSQPFVEESFDFYGRTLSGTKEIMPRWRRCAIFADTDLGDAVGQAYVARYFPPASKERMLQLVKTIEGALGKEIDAADWMSAETKKKAHVKLAAQVDKIAYPDHWQDYTSVDIKRDDFLGNMQRASRFEIDRRLSQIGKPVDRYHWGMTPPTVNAYEDAQTNTINFPAGILQPPFFDASLSDAINYGAIGAVIGHEIIHGYDDQGRKFDSAGNLKDWWTASDSTAYEKRDSCISDEYTQDVPEAGVKQNGKLSLGEDTADNGGVHIALAGLQRALKSQGKDLDSAADGSVTQLQTFFLAYANVWCGELRPEAARTAVLTQGHSLNRYRINNVVSNMSEFAYAFGCKAGQPMVRAKACRVW
ncbi:MAG: M13 family metallopeptidase [Terriglobales bacterium]